MGRTDRVSRLINAPLAWVYRALVDPEIVRQWLPPGSARIEIDEFDARPGGAIDMTLIFDSAEGVRRKRTENTDVVRGQFLVLETDRRVSQSYIFDSADPAFAGVMTMTWVLEPSGAGTQVTVTAEDVPMGISAEDHEKGMSLSLEKLAALATSS